MSDETINFNIKYNITNIDQTIGKTKSLLLTLNSVRLSIRDIQQVMSGPTIANVMWTAIQLTRVYTNLRRLIRQTSREQTALLAQTTLQFGAGGSLTAQGARSGLLGTLATFAGANPLLVGGAIAGVTVGSALILQRNRQDRAFKEFMERSREESKNQGWEF